MVEIWTKLTKFGYPNYSVSTEGRIMNHKSGYVLNFSPSKKDGYVYVRIRDENKKSSGEMLHRLVLAAFQGSLYRLGTTVDHINRIKTDNRLVNLRWATAIEQGRNKNPNSGYRSCEIRQLNLDGSLVKIWESRKKAASVLDLSKSSIGLACIQASDYAGYLWEDIESDIIPGEIWKEVTDPNFKDFLVSNMGRIRTNFGKVTYGSNNNGYRSTRDNMSGTKVKRMVHCLVAEAFLGKSDLLVNHKDGVKINNKLENLEYVTQSENCLHARRTGLHPGAKNRKPVIQYDLAGKEVGRYKSIKDATTAIGHDLRSALTDNTKTAYGYYWKFA
jgi:hypothetical protein